MHCIVAFEHNEQGVYIIPGVSVCCYVTANNYWIVYFKDADSFAVTLTHIHQNVACLSPVPYCIPNKEHPTLFLPVCMTAAPVRVISTYGSRVLECNSNCHL